MKKFPLILAVLFCMVCFGNSLPVQKQEAFFSAKPAASGGGGGGGGCTKAYVPAPGVGTGDRRFIVTCTRNGSAADFLVDGDTTSNGLGFLTGAAAGQTIQVDFGSGNAFVVTEFKWYQETADSHGTWQVQGSNDASSWTSIGSTFTLGGATTSTITTPSANTTAYRYYRLLGISGNTSSNPWIYELEIQTCQ